MSSQRASQSSSRKRKNDDSFNQPSTSRGHTSSRKRRLIEDDSDEEPSTSQSVRVSKHRRLTNAANETESHDQSKLAGRIEKIQMNNFMCHSNLEINLNERINFITGRNGSGKSAVMAALTVVLGGSAKVTGRGSGIADFIKKGENSGKVSITLINEGFNCYKPDTYGNRIIITRQFTKTANSYSVKSGFGFIVSKKKEEVSRIIMKFNIQINNPICILNQDIARTFLGATEPGIRFSMFMEATQLDEIKNSYASTFELLFMTQGTLQEKEKTFEEANKEIKDLKRRLELFLALQRDNEQKLLLENELIWSLVCIEERKLAALNESREEILKNKEEMENSEASYDDIIRSLQTQIREHEGTINEFTNTINEKRNVKGEYHREAQKIQKEIETVDSEMRRLKNKISHHLADINGIKEHMAQSEDNASQSQIDKVNAAEKIKEKKQELSEITDRMTSAQRDVSNAQETLEQYKVDMDRHKSDHRELERRKNHVEVRLNSANLSQSSQKSANLAKFGSYMPKLIEAINEAERRNQFQVKPMGPCGLWIHLKSDSRKWAHAVESIVNGFMPTFCCDSQKDFNVLSKIIDRVCANQRQPNLVICKFRSRHNVSSKTVTQIPSIVEQLDIRNDVVFNTLIDQAAIEGIGLFESDDQAGRFLSHVQNVPKNLSMGVTVKANQFYPAPNYRSYVTADRPLQFFDEPVKSKDAIKSIENELQEVEREIAGKNSEINELKMKIHRLGEFLQTKQNHLMELRHKKRKLEAELSELKDTEESRPTIQTRVALEEELQTHEKNHQKATEKLEACTEKWKTLKAEADIWSEKLRIATDEESTINAGLSAVQERLEEVKFALNKERKQKQTAGSKLEEAKKMLEKIDKDIKEREQIREEKLKDAMESAPERVDTNKSPADIEKALHKCRKKIQQAEKLSGNREDTIEEYKTKKEAFKKIKSAIRKMERAVDNLAKRTVEKQDRFEMIQQLTSNMVSFRFQAGLQSRGYDGSLKFDFENKTLDLEVKPRDEETARKDSKTLSGGERSYSTVSFILAIWKSIHMPFYFLDEFDVFMDKLNRKVIMDLLLDHCKHASLMQFAFITPQDISSIQSSDIVTIYKMPDPERRGLV